MRGFTFDQMVRIIGRWVSPGSTLANPGAVRLPTEPSAISRSGRAMCSDGAMFLGMGIFAVTAVVVVIIWVAMASQRRNAERDLPPEDQLTDDEFRRIEYGDDDVG